MKVLWPTLVALAMLAGGPLRAESGDAGRERQRIRAEREAAEARFAAEQQACGARFAVNDCIDAEILRRLDLPAAFGLELANFVRELTIAGRDTTTEHGLRRALASWRED